MWYVEGRDVLVWICFKYKILFCSIPFPSLPPMAPLLPFFASQTCGICFFFFFPYHRINKSQSERQQMSKESSQIRQHLAAVEIWGWGLENSNKRIRLPTTSTSILEKDTPKTSRWLNQMENFKTLPIENATDCTQWTLKVKFTVNHVKLGTTFLMRAPYKLYF